MFSLWKSNLKKFKNPSPKCKKIFPDKFFIERTSRFTFFGLLSAKAGAGMTVEAAIVLPMFLFFFINLGSSMEMIRLHQNLQSGLWNIGNRMCVYGYAVKHSEKAEKDEKEQLDLVGDFALTYGYVKSRIVEYCGKAYLEASPLSKGVDGLQFMESRVLSQDMDTPGDVIDIVVTYQVSPWLELPFVKPFRMSNRYYGRLWTGYDLTGASAGSVSQEMVYVTENRAVYHESLECTHLKLSIHTVYMEDLKTARNEYGRRYQMCSKCGKKGIQEDGQIFICKEGDFYHYNKNCPGLTRMISTITRQQAAEENLRPCSRCAVNKAK